MTLSLQNPKKIKSPAQPRKEKIFFQTSSTTTSSSIKKIWSYMTCLLGVVCLMLVFTVRANSFQKIISPLVTPFQSLQPLPEGKKGYEVFGFAPYWTFNKLNTVDFDTLTTMAYFGIPIDGQGNMVEDGPGYSTFISDQATQIFRKAHQHGTRVVLTITQMDNATIEEFLDSTDAQQNAINQVVAEVKQRGIDGVNVDFEYIGNPGETYRQQFSQFVGNLTSAIHGTIKGSKVTVSVYASSAQGPKLYDITQLAKNTDDIFMMAYDFAVAGSDNAVPTAPLYGSKQGKYSYDVSSAVEDFLKLMPADKLVLGVPYYGYNYLVYNPTVNAPTRPYYSWRGTPTAQTYDYATENVTADAEGVDAYKTGWDDVSKVGWRAYHVAETDTWRMIFLEDARSLSYKYDYVKSKSLAGVGMWALGFDQGHTELWSLLREKFGVKLADSRTAELAEIR